MEHRKWSFGSAPAAEVSLKELEREHGELYDEWKASERRVMETLDENNRLDRELDEARQRIAELESMLASEVADNVKLRAREVGDEIGNLLQELADANNRIAELEAPIRVPFSDAQIERMAVAAKRVHKECFYSDSNLVDIHTDEKWRRCVCAALAAADLDLADKAFYVREFAAVSQERDGLRERTSVPTVHPPDAQVEALARVLRAAPDKWWPALDETWDRVKDMYLDQARAAIAHLAKRPEGLPTIRDLREIGVHAYLSHDSAKRENAGCMVDPMGAATDAILTALRPWLRDPVGFELDVTAEEMEGAWRRTPGSSLSAFVVVLDLCRKRIKPIYECKECAARTKAIMTAPDVKCAGCEHWESNFNNLKHWYDLIETKLCAARAALEGE